MTPQIGAPWGWGSDADAGDRSRGGAGRSNPGLAESRHLRTVPPRPSGARLQRLAGHAAAVRPREDRAPLPLYPHGPPLSGCHLRQHLRVPQPTIGHHERGRQRQAPPAQCLPGPLPHDLQPGQLGTTRPPQLRRIRATHREIHRNDQLPLPDHDHQQQAINPEPDAMRLTALPGTHQPQLLAILFADTSRHPPRSRATDCGWPDVCPGPASTPVPTGPGPGVASA